MVPISRRKSKKTQLCSENFRSYGYTSKPIGETAMKTCTQLLLAVFLVCAAVTGASGEEKKFDAKYTVKPGGTLTLKTDVGSVRITGGSGNDVMVHADIKGKSSALGRYTVRAEHLATGVDVVGELEKEGWKLFGGDDIDVRFTVTVPSNYNIRVETAGGNLEVLSITGEVVGETSGGNIVLRDAEGRVDLETSGGNITVERVKGPMTVETSGGDIKISEVTGDLHAETSGGNITVSAADGKVYAETSGGDVSVMLIGANRGVHAETSGGDVEIILGKKVAADIDASTSGGEVVCDLPVTVTGRIRESSIKGTVNGGGNVIYAHTSGGDVRIRATK
jgi:hypothetical protein